MGTVQVSRVRVAATVHTATRGSIATVTIGTATGGTHRTSRGSTAAVTVGTASGWVKGSAGGSSIAVTISTVTAGSHATNRGSTAGVTLTVASGWNAQRANGSTAAVTIGNTTGSIRSRTGGSTSTITIGAAAGWQAVHPKATAGGSTIGITVGNTAGWTADHPKTAAGGSTAAITAGFQAAWTATHPKEATGGSRIAILVGAKTGYIPGRFGASETLPVTVTTEGAGIKYIDRTFWRDITVTAQLLDSPWQATLLESSWQAHLEQPMRISALTADFIVIRLEADVPLDMDPPFLGMSKIGLPVDWSQGSWRGNTAAVDINRYERRVEWFVGPAGTVETFSQQTTPGTWRVYYDLRDLPTRSVELAGTLVVGAA